LRNEEGRLQEIFLFVAVGIDLDGNKEVLGFWVLRGRENKGFWAEILQDLISRTPFGDPAVKDPTLPDKVL